MSIRARRLLPEDLREVKRLCEESNFWFDPYHFVDGVIIEREREVVGFGSLNTILEGTFAIQKDLKKTVRLDAFSRALTAMEISAKALKYDLVHTFVKEEVVARTLVKRFDFQETKSGKTLIRYIK